MTVEPYGSARTVFWIVDKRKALTPNDVDSRDALGGRLLRFADHYRQIAQPFAWTFTREDLNQLLAGITAHQPRLTLAA